MDHTFCRLRGCAVAAAALLLLLLIYMTYLRQSYTRTTIKQLRIQSALTKPQNITVSGLVFYGRKDRVSCMHSYLEVSCQDR
jgi:hypothetical protein